MKYNMTQQLRYSQQILATLLLMGFLAVTLIGCSKESTNQSSELTLGRPLRIGIMPDTGAIPLLIAQEMGYFDNLAVEITLFTSAQNRDAALTSGALDGAMVDMLAVIFYQDGGYPFFMTSQSVSDFRWIASPKLSEPLYDTVGISKHTVIDFVSNQFATTMNTPLSAVYIPPIPLRLEALIAGELDTAILPDPFATLAVQAGGAEIMSSQELTLKPGVLVFSEELIKDHGNTLMSLYKGYNQAVDYLISTPQEEYYSIIAKKLKFPEQVEGFITFPTFEHAQAPDTATFSAVLAWAQQNNLTSSDYTLEELTATDILP